MRARRWSVRPGTCGRSLRGCGNVLEPGLFLVCRQCRGLRDTRRLRRGRRGGDTAYSGAACRCRWRCRHRRSWFPPYPAGLGGPGLLRGVWGLRPRLGGNVESHADVFGGIAVDGVVGVVVGVDVDVGDGVVDVGIIELATRPGSESRRSRRQWGQSARCRPCRHRHPATRPEPRTACGRRR